MKVRKKHKVPLSDEAISIIELMRKKHNHEYVFTNPVTGRHISNGAMLIFLKKQFPHLKITVHGFRSSFRDWAEEIGQYQHNAIEFCLAHELPNKVEKAYLRSDLIDTRKIIKSAKKAQIHGFIKNLPMGYDTNIGEMGIKLSGGQRQRLGIARAIYNIYDKNKKILILDEATSALDYEVEDLIIKSIYEIRNDLTLIMISHRLNTLQNCDRILEIKNGSIVSDGKKNL